VKDALMFNANISNISAYRGVKDALMFNANISSISAFKHQGVLHTTIS
jgi:hypothetical protein